MGTMKPATRTLGYDPAFEPRQVAFAFDPDARAASHTALLEGLPAIIHGWNSTAAPLTLGSLFGSTCNETPTTKRMMAEALVDLRDAREIEIVSKEGRQKPRSGKVDWGDAILLPPQRTLVFPARR